MFLLSIKIIHVSGSRMIPVPLSNPFNFRRSYFKKVQEPKVAVVTGTTR
jgi:hypothetical protein